MPLKFETTDWHNTVVVKSLTKGYFLKVLYRVFTNQQKTKAQRKINNSHNQGINKI